MKRFQILLSVLFIGIIVFPFRAPPALAAPSDDCLSSWSPVATPSPAAGTDTLNAVDAYAENDVWAVGTRYLENVPINQTLIQHWDGVQWSTVASPNVPDASNVLNVIAAYSPTNAWAVGFSSRNGVSKTLIQHWDGATWTIVPSPNGTDGSGELSSVAVESADDVWAAGRSGYENLLLHWNGTTWQTAELPIAGRVRVISGPGGHVWAMSSINDESATILSWTGSDWTTEAILQLPSPSLLTRMDDFIVLAQDDIWVSGKYTYPHDQKGLLWHWDGYTWTPYTHSPSTISGIAGVSAQNIWTFGPQDYIGGPDWGAMFSRWNGTDWSKFWMRDAFPQFNPNGITAVSADELWIVGAPRPTSSSPNASGILHGQFTCTAPPPVPTLESPANNAVVTTMYPTLDWQDLLQVRYYNLEVNDSTGANVRQLEGLLGSEYQIYFPEIPNGDYTWRVQVCSYSGCSEWSALSAFSMQVSAPTDAPQLLSPETGSNFASQSKTFSWSAAAEGSTYAFQLFRDSLDGDPTTSSAQHSYPTITYFDLSEGHYFWRARACNTGGCGPWAEPFEFTIFIPTPARPILHTPAAKATVKTLKPWFGWQASEASTYYHLQIRQGTRKGPIVKTVGPLSTINYRWKVPLVNGKYFWRVQACNQVDRCGKWTKPRKFFVDK